MKNMSNQVKKLYGTSITLKDVVGLVHETKLQSKGKVVGIEAEFRNPHSLKKLIRIIREVKKLPYIIEPGKVQLKFESKDILEINSYPFREKELTSVLKDWSLLKDFGLTSTHLSYSGNPWEILNKIGLTAAVIAPVWRSFWNPKRLDSWSQCWPHIRDTTILPREFGVVSIVSQHRFHLCVEIRYVGRQIEALGKILPFALKNHEKVNGEDFKPLELDIPYLNELKREITHKIKYPHYTKNVAVMVAWPFCISESSLFRKFLPNTCKYCVDNRDDLLGIYTSLAESYSKERHYSHLDAAKDVANWAAKRNIIEVYEVLHY